MPERVERTSHKEGGDLRQEVSWTTAYQEPSATEIGNFLAKNLSLIDNADAVPNSGVILHSDGRIDLSEIKAVIAAGAWKDQRTLTADEKRLLQHVAVRYDKLAVANGQIDAAVIEDLQAGARFNLGRDRTEAIRPDGTRTVYPAQTDFSATTSPDGTVIYRNRTDGSAAEFEMRANGTGKFRFSFGGLKQDFVEVPMQREANGDWVIKDAEGNVAARMHIDLKQHKLRIETAEGDLLTASGRSLFLRVANGEDVSEVRGSTRAGSDISLRDGSAKVSIRPAEGLIRATSGHGETEYATDSMVNVRKLADGSIALSHSEDGMPSVEVDKNGKAHLFDAAGKEVALEVRADGSQFARVGTLQLNVHSDRTINLSFVKDGHRHNEVLYGSTLIVSIQGSKVLRYRLN